MIMSYFSFRFRLIYLASDNAHILHLSILIILFQYLNILNDICSNSKCGNNVRRLILR